MAQAIEDGYLAACLIERGLHERQGKAIHNFPATMPPADSDMAAQVFKDPYLFDFLGTADPRREREVEQALTDHIQRFLLELGATFAEVSKTQLEGFEIPLPPLPEQKRIAGILNEQMAAVERARKVAEEELATINALPAALLRRVFKPACAEAASAGRGKL